MATKYIAIAGNMGSGKSSLVDFLCHQYELKPFFEPHDVNPFLGLFYTDMKRWAFHSQMHFLTQKFRIHQELDHFTGTVIQDRTIYEDDVIFALNLYRQGCLSKEEFRTYRHLYDSILAEINPPDLLIYLECPLRALQQRIAHRGRVLEKHAPDDYLRRLDRFYKRWIEKYDRSPIMKLSTAKMDYLSDFIDRQDLLKRIERYV